ncbi:hypothetical protein K470DRAFT_255837 [Piedraia hortae CBS 480.64]|uniref:Uncharacterized protein n=1 Tax=Piedraia hortae CBS 480.64 TaxID=1314780 RepID=A0A6A7C597_9PEZI|nr:hypothetical protein K470DRAFT_255837 [Piedraia hortae CBS 480.64]
MICTESPSIDKPPRDGSVIPAPNFTGRIPDIAEFNGEESNVVLFVTDISLTCTSYPAALPTEQDKLRYLMKKEF